MGVECNCLKDDKENEFIIGSENYKFKKMVGYNNYTNLIFIKKFKYFYLIQILPRTKSEEMFYGKDSTYDKDVKNRIDRTSSLIRNGVSEYTNGNVEVIVPCASKDL